MLIVCSSPNINNKFNNEFSSVQVYSQKNNSLQSLVENCKLLNRSIDNIKGYLDNRYISFVSKKTYDKKEDTSQIADIDNSYDDNTRNFSNDIRDCKDEIESINAKKVKIRKSIESNKEIVIDMQKKKDELDKKNSEKLHIQYVNSIDSDPFNAYSESDKISPINKILAIIDAEVEKEKELDRKKEEYLDRIQKQQDQLNNYIKGIKDEEKRKIEEDKAKKLEKSQKEEGKRGGQVFLSDFIDRIESAIDNFSSCSPNKNKYKLLFDIKSAHDAFDANLQKESLRIIDRLQEAYDLYSKHFGESEELSKVKLILERAIIMHEEAMMLKSQSYPSRKYSKEMSNLLEQQAQEYLDEINTSGSYFYEMLLLFPMAMKLLDSIHATPH